jgi:hypothetical protein
VKKLIEREREKIARETEGVLERDKYQKRLDKERCSSKRQTDR